MPPPAMRPTPRNHLGGEVEVQALSVLQHRRDHCQGRTAIAEVSRRKREHRVEQEVLFGEIGFTPMRKVSLAARG